MTEVNFQIPNRWTGKVQFECVLPPEIATMSSQLRLGYAVKKALQRGADLRGANLGDADLCDANLCDADLRGASLRGADLRGANLRDANLRGANLGDADLRGANLYGADLYGADLYGANLYGANLGGADLRDADLNGANLHGANLRDANLCGANLHGADLRGANLCGADLYGANLHGADLGGANLRDADLRDADLRGANLHGADLHCFKQDLIAEVLRLPNELEALRLAIVEGRIDGSTYTGDCACLAGTLAKAAGVEFYNCDIDLGPVKFHADALSPREQWFAMISPGQKPGDNQAAALALEWVNEAIAIRDNIRGMVVATGD